MKTSLRPNASRPLLAASLAVLIAFGCSDQGTEPPTSPVATPDLSARAGQSSASQQDLGPALAAQKRHGERLMAIAGVVGHGVGLVEGEPGIKVFLLRPGVAGVPSRLDDVPVAVEVTGMFVAGGTTDETSPAPNGYSVGHPNITAGTLGAVVKDAADVCYILGNNHVLANSNDASLGDNTLQPGPFDGGQDPEDALATLSAFEPIAFDGSANTIDAAIAELISPTFVTAETPAATGYGAPGTTPVGASVGQQLQKFGRTTLLTNGQVTEIEVTANICYECAGPFCFGCKKLARFTDLVATEDMSGGGDSGSLMVTDDASKNPVALLFAGSSTRTLANEIDLVLDRFNVNVVNSTAACSSGGTPANNPPTADFTYATAGLTADFTDQSTDGDGTVVAWSWDFGDPARTDDTSTDPNPPWTYDAAGTYTVSLTVTDDDGDTDTLSQDVTVTDGGTGGITLTASGSKTRGVRTAELSWSGATSTNVDIYRDGGLWSTTENDGEETDDTLGRGGSVTYQICEAGTSTCSNVAIVTF